MFFLKNKGLEREFNQKELEFKKRREQNDREILILQKELKRQRDQFQSRWNFIRNKEQ